MVAKISISLTEEHARMLDEAVASGEYVSSSEVVREALRDWRAKRLLAHLCDEGIGGGSADPGETIDDIKKTARRRD
jgi:antitoxin ParD1/3/4